MKQRSLFWDNYKGILIFLVVFGHMIYTRATNVSGGVVRQIFTFIYFFHMPAFIFSSGYFSRSEKASSEKAIVRLLLYYLAFNSLTMVYYTIRYQQLPQLLIPYSSYWYLLALIFWRIGIKYLEKVKGILPMAIMAALLVGFWAEISNVLALSRTIAFFPFFLLGYKFDAEKFREKLACRTVWQKVLCALFALIVAVGLFAAAGKVSFSVNLLCAMPYTAGKQVLYRAALMIAASVAIVALLVAVPDVKIPVLTKLGRNSLLIYVLHRFFVLAFDRFVPLSVNVWIFLVLAIAAAKVVSVILGSDRLNAFTAKLFDKAAGAVCSREHKKGRMVVAVILIFALAVSLLPLCKPVHIYLHREEPVDVAKTIENSVVIAYVGDLVLLKEQVESGYDEQTDSYDFSEMFRYVGPYLTEADLAVGVLEGPLAGEEAGYSTSDYDDGIDFYLNFPDAFARNIKEAGIDLVTTANNHVMDRGAEGALRTLDVLDEAGLAHTGTYRNDEERNTLLLVEAGGLQIAVLSYTQLVNGYTTEEMAAQHPYLTAIMPDESSSRYEALKESIEQDFQRARASGADVIAVMPHMGTQFSLKTDAFQKKWNALFAELGADVILGDHSHCPQPLEYIGDTLVVNCPGNLADGFTGYNSDAKALVEIYLDRDTGKVKGAAVIPMYTQEMERGFYRALPIYDVFVNEELKAEMWSRDLERMKEVQTLVTKTMLGKSIPVSKAQPRYFYIDGAYRPYIEN